MSEELIGKTSEDMARCGHYDVGTNGEALRFSDCLLTSVVRSLLYDVDLLLISSALDVLGEKQGTKALQYLRRYVGCHGIPGYKYPLPRSLRHRKTVLYTTKLPSLGSPIADSLLLIPEDGNTLV